MPPVAAPPALSILYAQLGGAFACVPDDRASGPAPCEHEPDDRASIPGDRGRTPLGHCGVQL